MLSQSATDKDQDQRGSFRHGFVVKQSKNGTCLQRPGPTKNLQPL